MYHMLWFYDVGITVMVYTSIVNPRHVPPEHNRCGARAWPHAISILPKPIKPESVALWVARGSCSTWDPQKLILYEQAATTMHRPSSSTLSPDSAKIIGSQPTYRERNSYPLSRKAWSHSLHWMAFRWPPTRLGSGPWFEISACPPPPLQGEGWCHCCSA